MTHKSYHAAAAEVGAGRLDDALWVKVCTELPEASERERQAKYIALRARELSTADFWASFKDRDVPRFFSIAAVLGIVVLVLILLGMLVGG